MPGVGFANYINIALSTDYLTFATHFLYRSPDFHERIRIVDYYGFVVKQKPTIIAF